MSYKCRLRRAKTQSCVELKGGVPKLSWHLAMEMEGEEREERGEEHGNYKLAAKFGEEGRRDCESNA